MSRRGKQRAQVPAASSPAYAQDDIIDNLEADGDYYARCSLTIRVGEKDALWKGITATGGALEGDGDSSKRLKATQQE